MIDTSVALVPSGLMTATDALVAVRLRAGTDTVRPTYIPAAHVIPFRSVKAVGKVGRGRGRGVRVRTEWLGSRSAHPRAKLERLRQHVSLGLPGAAATTTTRLSVITKPLVSTEAREPMPRPVKMSASVLELPRATCQ